MSGLVRSIGKQFKRLDGKKLATGLAIAAGVYYLGGMASGSFDGAPTSSGDESAGLDMNPNTEGPPVDLGATAGVQPGIEADTGLTTPPETPAPEVPAVPTAPVAPTAQAPQPAPQPQASAPATSAPATAQAATAGKVGNLGDGAINGAAKWFQGLSPAAQAVLAGGVAGGAGAVINALAQKNAQEDAREREERFRQDRVRRGRVEAMPESSFTSKGGVIDNYRRG